jgi:hypothetical protein
VDASDVVLAVVAVLAMLAALEAPVGADGSVATAVGAVPLTVGVGLDVPDAVPVAVAVADADALLDASVHV